MPPTHITHDNLNPTYPITLLSIFLLFARIGVTSFGGGVSGWMMREFVMKRHWISKDEFLSGLALSQAFPGINVVNLSIWVGFKLRGSLGALCATIGIVVPAMFVVILMAMLYSYIKHVELVQYAMSGIAAAAIGLSFEMGAHAASRVVRDFVATVTMIVTFLCIYALKLHLVVVALAIAPLSIYFAYLRLKRQQH